MKVGLFFDCGQPLLEISVERYVVWNGFIRLCVVRTLWYKNKDKGLPKDKVNFSKGTLKNA